MDGERVLFLVIRRIATRYLATAGLLANVGLASFFAFWFVNKIGDSDVYHAVRLQVLGTQDGVDVVPINPAGSGQVNPELRALPAGTWHKIHQHADEGFERQAHAGAAFDPVRGRLMVFGSDTHDQDWDNSVRFFDMAALRWSRAYPPDAPDTYRVNSDGVPVAGNREERPWAMHTFDSVEFDPLSDILVVASHPGHLNPNTPHSNAIDPELWREIEHHPTWGYHVESNLWRPIALKGISYFPYGATFDPFARELIGVKPDGYRALSLDSGIWRKLGKGSPRAWHNTAAFDSEHRIVLTFGTNWRDNSIWQFEVGGEKGRKMPTPGERPPGADSAPLVYHPGIKKVVALVERPDVGSLGITETWLYDTLKDSWEAVPSADLPFAIGMNYQMVYDPNHDIMVLVANAPRDPVSVWVLRLQQASER
jgi:hypothetical protein